LDPSASARQKATSSVAWSAECVHYRHSGPNAQTFGDVDIAFKLFQKQPPEGKKWTGWNVERANAPGLRLDHIDELYFDEREVTKPLKACGPRLSLQEWASFQKVEADAA
jgi:hypothetical protein